MNLDWVRIRNFIHRRTFFCAVTVWENDAPRMFAIGSLRVGRDGSATYFELFARPVQEGAKIAFLAVDASVWFWLKSLFKGRFEHPPALRLYGTAGERRQSTQEEQDAWHRRVGLLLKTPGGKALWSKPGPIRELLFDRVEAVNLGKTTKHLKNWVFAQ